jgi:ABC-type phosphate transport system substrate-binding protein
MSKLKLLMGASALIVAATSGAANAQVAIYGGGSTLIAPYARQAEDCYGTDVDLLFKTGAATAPTVQDVNDFNYINAANPAKDFNCASQHINTNVTLWYNGTGSGTGIDAIFTHDPTQFGPYDGSGHTWPEVHYAHSDTALVTADVNVYNNGGVERGKTYVAPGVTPGPGQFANPSEHFGAMVQFPVLVAPVTLAYAPVYKKIRDTNGDGGVTEYKFHIKAPRADGSGGLKLSQAAYCGILNGTITDWNNATLKTLNGNTSLKDTADPTSAGTWSVPMQLVGRFDGSGTTFILSRALTAQCGAFGTNNYTGASSNLPAALQGPHWLKTGQNTPQSGETLGKFTLADGSDGVAKYIDFGDNPSDPNGSAVQPGPNPGDSVTRGRIGYIGADFVLPYVNNTGANVYGLNTANLQNASLKYIVPSSTSALAAFTGTNAPQSDVNGVFTPADTSHGLRANPQDWVLAWAATNPLANPANAKAYPLTGTTQFLGYTCYTASNIVSSLAATTGTVGYLDWYLTALTITDAKAGILAKAGYATMPKGWLTATINTFLKGNDGLNLKFAQAGVSPQCTGKSGA